MHDDDDVPTPKPDQPPERGGSEGDADEFLESLVNDPIPPVDEAGEPGGDETIDSLIFPDADDEREQG
ncbi:MAG TPA: hypothetical protein VHF89_02525 [Solirubrobacteraceae bacterium]|nr:hypothetical protein [Solirubrobacteraceae bacterium]